MNRFFALAVITLAITAASTTTTAVAGDTGAIRGKVVDAVTGLPIAGATIVVSGRGFSRDVNTDTSGFYVVLGVPMQRLAVYASMPDSRTACPFYVAPIPAGEVKDLSFTVKAVGDAEQCKIATGSESFDPDRTQDVDSITTY